MVDREQATSCKGASGQKPAHLGHRKRLRKRWKVGGLRSFHDYEVLELLLTYVMRRIDTKLIAKALIDEFGSLSRVFDATEGELQGVKGIGQRAAQLIVLVKAAAVQYLRDRLVRGDVLGTPQAVVDYCRTLLAGRRNESVHVLLVDGRNAVLDDMTLFEGTTNQSATYPRRIVEDALSRGASGVILVHNHPGGVVTPSREDETLTRKVKEALGAAGICLLDHLVVGREGYYSFREAGHLI